MFYFYVLYSLKDQKLYKGITSDIVARFHKHNSGDNKSTAQRKPFVIIYLESFANKSEALKAEKFYKSLKGGSQLRENLKIKFPSLFTN